MNDHISDGLKEMNSQPLRNSLAELDRAPLDTSRRWESQNLPSQIGLADLYVAPGQLIRRSQQIAVAIFMDEFKNLSITPVQYSDLVAIRDNPGIEQRKLVELVAMDRSTIGSVLRGMEDKQWIRRITPQDNLRIKRLSILPAGRSLLASTTRQIVRAQERILDPLAQDERELLIQLLSKVVRLNNHHSRAPMKQRDALP